MNELQADKARRFIDLHKQGTFISPNPWDLGSARLLEHLGFSALATSSAGLAFSHGRPDNNMNRNETLAHAQQLAEAVSIPVSADLENGFGDAPEAAAETIKLAVLAGLAGGSIEDSTGRPDQPVYSIEQAADRIRAAAEQVRLLGRPFMLTARAENHFIGRPDLADTIRRLQAYQEAGADVLFAPGLATLDEVKAVLSSIDRPLNMLAGANLTVAQLRELGVRRISVGGSLARAALGALKRAAEEIRDQGTFGYLQDAMPMREAMALFARK